MGEMADEVIDIIFNYDYDMWPHFYSPPRRPRCNRCGKTCNWGKVKNGWRLYDLNGKPHACPTQVASVDEFDVVQ